MSASSSRERVPNPATVISAVLLTAFGMDWSAPSDTSNCINSGSAVLAASGSGVAPTVFRPVSPNLMGLVISIHVRAALHHLSYQFQTGHAGLALRRWIIIAESGFSHVCDHVQRAVSHAPGPSRTSFVSLHAGLENSS